MALVIIVLVHLILLSVNDNLNNPNHDVLQMNNIKVSRLIFNAFLGITWCVFFINAGT
jgi:hypothetical protein